MREAKADISLTDNGLYMTMSGTNEDKLAMLAAFNASLFTSMCEHNVSDEEASMVLHKMVELGIRAEKETRREDVREV